MEYKINTLAEKYIQALNNVDIAIKKPTFPIFDLSAYNDYEYLTCIKKIENEFNQFDDFKITLDFLNS